MNKNANAVGNPIIKILPMTTVPGPPSSDVKAKQDPSHSREDFTRDLDKVTQRSGDRQ
jgi:hypothetical protein